MSPAKLLTDASRFLFPGDAESDGGFRLEVQRLGRRSLYSIGVIGLGLLTLVYPLVLLLLPGVPDGPSPLAFGFAVVYWGVAPLVAARTPWGLRFGREIALVVLFLAAVGAIHFDAAVTDSIHEAEKFVLADSIGTLLLAVVLVPALPVQMFLLGAGITVAFAVVWLYGDVPVPADYSSTTMLMLLSVTALLCTVLAAVSYRRLWASYQSNRQVLETQRHLLMTENAAAMGKLAAAMSHEFNNPLGVLRSCTETLRELRIQGENAPAERRRRLSIAIAQLEDNAAEALDRMERIVRRMQRFTNLDRADERPFDVNEMVRDVVALLDRDPDDGVDLRLELNEAPRVTSKPQVIAAVMTRLLHESIAGASPDGWVKFATSAAGSEVRVALSDSRPAIPADDLAEIFQPHFRSAHGRIQVHNWTWYNARQILQEHGADLSLTSDPNVTTVTISIPVSAPTRV